MKFKGFRRKNGQVGIRNYYLIIGVCDALDGIVNGIAKNYENVLAVTSEHGCPAAGNEQIINNLAGLADNPNIVGVIIMGMGCEGVRPEMVQVAMNVEKPVKIIKVTEIGGTVKAIEQGRKTIEDMMKSEHFQRELVDVSEITLGVKCGGSDTTSGIAGNTCAGFAVDKLIDNGGTAIFTEPIECIGGEESLIERAINKKVANDIKNTISAEEKRWTIPGVNMEFMCYGNIRGGLSTIEEKSLGAIHKSGSRPIQGVLKYNDDVLEKPSEKGIYLQDGTMLFSHCITHLAAAGCQMLLFITGIGASVLSQAMPTIKICGNSSSYKNLIGDMDINAGSFIEGTKTIKEIGDEIFDKMIRVAEGEKTKLEGVGYSGFAIYKKDARLEHFLNEK
jgi:altronate dehydratase large subunit